MDAEADIAAIVSGLDGGSEPFKLDDEPGESKPAPEPPAGGDLRADPGGLAAALAAQALKLKKAEDVAPLPPPREKTEEEMSFTELIAWKAARLKKREDDVPKVVEEEKKEAPTPPPEPVVEEEKKAEPESTAPVSPRGMDTIVEDDEDSLEESKLEESKIEEPKIEEKKDMSPI